ncbi:hypothetical protein BDV24DRAFT_159009 [Aspergillus arachidicola]|uniref:Ankyrin repeat-containing domain protein n=1 Tax=Aspergillus arachidicola TaxID=656916 RepID=A0A5N6YL02_9EURO|nr:hypothetical protein BDV24DRAFT_159009 [Aspergillus arachidicola]
MIKEAASTTEDSIVACQRILTMLLIKQLKALKKYYTSPFLRVYGNRPALHWEVGIPRRIGMMWEAGAPTWPQHWRLLAIQDQNQDDVSSITTWVNEDEDDEIFNRTMVEPDTISGISQFSSTLEHSIDKADVDTILELLQHKHDPLAHNKDGWFALNYAARTNNQDVFKPASRQSTRIVTRVPLRSSLQLYWKSRHFTSYSRGGDKSTFYRSLPALATLRGP